MKTECKNEHILQSFNVQTQKLLILIKQCLMMDVGIMNRKM